MREIKRRILGGAIALMLFFIGMVAGIQLCLIYTHPMISAFIGLGNIGLLLLWFILARNFPKKE